MATGIGETLVAARRRQGVALSDAAAETRVRESYLAALEAEDFAALGGDVYVKGFLRSYARFLRLDPEPLVAAYREEHERHHHDDVSPLATQPVAPLPGERSPGWIVGLGVAVVVIAVLAVIGLLGRNNDDPEGTDLVAPPPVETVLPSAPPTGSPTASPTTGPTTGPTDQPTEVLASDTVQLELEMDAGPSWLVVIVDGVTQVESEQPEGTVLEFEGEEIVVTIGDAGAVTVRVNGEDRGRLGERREVIERTYTAEGAA